MSARPWSLRGRLLRRVLALVILGWSLTLGVGLLVMWREMGEIQDDALADEAAMVLIAVRGGYAIGEAAPLVGTAENLRIVTPAGMSGAAEWPPRDEDGTSRHDDWRIFRASDPSGYAVEIGGPASERREDFIEAARAFVEPMIPILFLLMLVIGATTRSAVAPVRAFAEALSRRDADDLSPVEATGLPDEFAPAPVALNHYLGRLSALREAERLFTANAAHELRTPLAIAAAQAQLLAEGRAGADAAQAISGAIGQLSAVVEKLLQLARAEAGIAPAATGADLVRLLRLLAADAGPGRVVFDDGDMLCAPVLADPDALAILFRNLIENALAHGTGRVRIVLRAGPEVTVINPVGPDAAFLQDRFARGPGSSGSGLGLSIIAEICAQLGFGIGFEIADGVARVTLTAPPPVA